MKNSFAGHESICGVRDSTASERIPAVPLASKLDRSSVTDQSKSDTAAMAAHQVHSECMGSSKCKDLRCEKDYFQSNYMKTAPLAKRVKLRNNY